MRQPKTPQEDRARSAARARYCAVMLLHAAKNCSGINEDALAARLGVKSLGIKRIFYGDGHITVTMLAELLHELGFKVNITIEPRKE